MSMGDRHQMLTQRRITRLDKAIQLVVTSLDFYYVHEFSFPDAASLACNFDQAQLVMQQTHLPFVSLIC